MRRGIREVRRRFRTQPFAAAGVGLAAKDQSFNNIKNFLGMMGAASN